MVFPVQYVHIGLGAAVAIGSVPLMLRKVPMNTAYGIRTRKAFVSEENWYRINEYGGRLFKVIECFQDNESLLCCI